MQQKDLITEATLLYYLISSHSFWEGSVSAAEGQYLKRIVKCY